MADTGVSSSVAPCNQSVRIFDPVHAAFVKHAVCVDDRSLLVGCHVCVVIPVSMGLVKRQFDMLVSLKLEDVQRLV